VSERGSSVRGLRFTYRTRWLSLPLLLPKHQATIFSTRTPGWWFLSRPSVPLVLAFCVAQLGATLIGILYVTNSRRVTHPHSHTHTHIQQLVGSVGILIMGNRISKDAGRVMPSSRGFGRAFGFLEWIQLNFWQDFALAYLSEVTLQHVWFFHSYSLY